MLGHKTCLSKFNKTGKLKKKCGNWINGTLLKSQELRKYQKGNKKHLESNEMQIQHTRIYGVQ